ncbi:MAG: hypothetical protein RL033_3117 [Pseudomonadota bacterium]
MRSRYFVFQALAVISRARWVSTCALGVFALGVLAISSCAAPPPAAPSVTPPPPDAPLQLGALNDFVPAAGLRWLVTGSPRYFAQHPALAGTRQRWLTDQRLGAFAQATGVDLLRTEHALIAGFDLGTLYLADASGWVGSPQEPFVDRLAGSARVQRPHPEVWRITGLVGSQPQALVRLANAVLAVAVGDPLLARIVEYRARGRLRDVAPALHGAALSALPAELLEPGPLHVYVPGPFSEQALPEGAGLLTAASAVGAALEIDGAWLTLRLALPGYWDEARDAERLLALWHAFATSTLGSALGLEDTREAVSVQASAQCLQLSAALAVQRVLSGVEGLAEGRLGPLLEPAAGAQSPESPR